MCLTGVILQVWVCEHRTHYIEVLEPRSVIVCEGWDAASIRQAQLVASLDFAASRTSGCSASS